MKVKKLFAEQYTVVAVMIGDTCPAEDFLLDGEASTEAARFGLRRFLEDTASRGLRGIPSAWFREVNKPNGIYEFKKGPLRLFFFKGENGQIAVCTTGVRKSGQKVDSSSVSKAIRLRDQYLEAVKSQTLEVEDED